MSPEHMESRRVPRVKVFIKVNVQIDASMKGHFDISKKDIEAHMLDVSILGIGILSKYFIPKGAILDLTFSLPLKSENQEQKEQPFAVQGCVRSAIPWGKGFTRVGVEFSQIDDVHREVLGRFIEQNLGRQT